MLFTALLILAAEPLQEKLQDLDVGVNWIYDDLPAGMKLARETGRPPYDNRSS